MSRSPELHSRLSPDRVHPFQPEDYPDLWNLTHGRDGIGGLRAARTSDVLKMFVPRAICDNLPIMQDDGHGLTLPPGPSGPFHVLFYGKDNFYLLCAIYAASKSIVAV